jgi:outer membrane protein assembly factor BamB
MVKQHLVVMAGMFSAVVAVLASFRMNRRARPEEPSVAHGLVVAADAGLKGRAPGAGKVSSGPPRMLHLDPHHTDRSPFTGPSAPQVAWVFDAQGPIAAAPAILDDGTIVVASLSGVLFGLTESGQQRYSVDLGDRIYSAPLVHDDALFVGSDVHKFFGLTPGGSIRFRLDADSDVDTGPAPTPWGGIVFAGGKVVYASKPDGTVLWRMHAKRKVYSSPAVADDGTVYVGSQDHHLYAVAPDGNVRWRVDLGADIDSAPAIEDDGTVVVGSDKGEVVALDPTGDVKWHTDVGGFVRGAMSVARDGTVLAGTYGPTPALVALDPANGRQRFRFAIAGTGAPEFGIHGGPVEDAKGRLYFGAQDDNAYCLSADGALVWKFKTGGDVDAALVITPHGTLLVGSDDGKLYALQAN